MRRAMKILVTGGAGFIGSAVVRLAIGRGLKVVNLDKLSYSANLENLASVADNPRYVFEQADIADGDAVAAVLRRHQPDAILHLAAESHVDRSIDGPLDFVQANIVGTAVLLERARAYWDGLPGERKQRFRFQNISTDEVFGTLGADGRFDEGTAYDPSSPYSASKAAADMLVRAWGRTFGLPVTLTNCSNNYGPFQFPEKLIPVALLTALEDRPIPVYGEGLNVRDWLFVDDHAEALLLVLEKGRLGETYCIGGETECSNIALVRQVCAHLDRLRPRNAGVYADLISHVADRPGHDFRYAVDTSKIRAELGWSQRTPLAEGLEATVRWYLDNGGWWERIRARGHKTERLGLGRSSRAGVVR
jgi:dTDP-glucose 4,6-dehydratase